MLNTLPNPKPKPIKIINEKPCEDCGNIFQPRHWKTKFCDTCVARRDKESWQRYANSSKALQTRRGYRKKNKDAIRTKHREYVNKNKDKLQAQAHVRYIEKRERYLPILYQQRKENPPQPHIDKVCEGCGKEYKSFRKKSRFCSRLCADKAKAGNVPKNCAWCGKEFYVSVSQEKLRNRTCCSKKCGGRHRARYGEKNNWWRGGVSSENRRQRYSANVSEWRKSVFERDSYTCRDCGVRGGYLHAHHIKPWAKHPELRFDLDNGKTLCKNCHKLEHDRIGWR